MPITNAMVLAAGLGTRMRPLTNTLPKPLVPIAGRPMIDIVLDLLVEAGVETVVVNVHYLADLMEAHLAERARPRIILSDERAQLMNSGGGLAKGLALLEPGPVLVMNADLFWIGEPRSNLRRLAEAFDPARMDMLMLCARLEDTTGHNGTKDFSLGADGRLTRYRNGLPQPVVYAGAIAMDSRLLADAPAEPFNLNVTFNNAIAAGRLHGLILEGHWITVGTPEAVSEAEEVIARLAKSA